MPADTAILMEIGKKVLRLARNLIHEASQRELADGVKVDGRQVSSASAVSILTFLNSSGRGFCLPAQSIHSCRATSMP